MSADVVLDKVLNPYWKSSYRGKRLLDTFVKTIFSKIFTHIGSREIGLMSNIFGFW